MPTVGLQDMGTHMVTVMVTLTEALVDTVIRMAVQEEGTVTHVRHLAAANASRHQLRITLTWKVSMMILNILFTIIAERRNFIDDKY